MKAAGVGAALMVVVAAAGCVENTAPGNDREAAIDPVGPPASMASASDALSGVDASLLKPEIMPPADLEVLPRMEGACRFRMTAVGFPVLIYGSQAVVKLNGRLVALPARGDGRYGDAGVEVTVRPLDPEAGQDEPFEAEFVLRLKGVANELGFHGVGECVT